MSWLRAAIDASHEAMLLSCASDDVVLHANARAYELFGYLPGELVGMRRDQLIEPSPASSTFGDASVASEAWLVRKGLARFRAEVSTVQVEDAGRGFAWTTVRDLSALDALRESEEKFRALSEATLEGIVIHKNGVILLTNLANDLVFRGVPGTSSGRNIFEFIAPESQAYVLEQTRAETTSPYEIVCRREDGTTFPAEIRARPLTYRGEALRMVAIRDLTERKTLETKLAMADRLATLGRLAAAIAHEINNPLAYVQLNLEILRGELGALGIPDEDPVRKRMGDALGLSLEGVARVSRIVKDLGGFTRGASGALVAVDLSRVVAFAASITKSEMDQRAGMEIDIDAPPVLGDETRLGQVFLNLLMNAAQAIPDGDPPHHTVRVTARRGAPGWVDVAVSDTGVGIPPAIVPHIFEPFVTTKSRGGGTGLGLFVVRDIVHSLGGTIEVAAAGDRGTTFRMTLREAVAAADAKDSAGELPTPEVTHE